MSKKNLPISLSIAMTLKAIECAFRKSIQRLGIDLQPESFGILMITYFQDNAIQQDIAEMAKKDKSAVLRQIDVLEKKGLVQRRIDSHDRRKNFIIITEEGKLLISNVIDKEQELIDALTKGVEPHEIKTFIRVLSFLKTNAESI